MLSLIYFRIAISIEDVSRQIAEENLKAIALLEGWLKHLGKTLALEFPQKTLSPENTLLAPCTLPTPYSLETSQLIQPPSDRLVWVKVIKGKTDWLGFADLLLDENSPCFPLVKGMWLTAQSPTEIKIIPTFQYLNSDRLSDSLTLFHQYFCHALNFYLREVQLNKYPIKV